MGIDINNDQFVVKTPLLREICFGLRENLPRGTSVQEAKQRHAIRTGTNIDSIEDFAEKPESIYRRHEEFLGLITQYLSSSSSASAPLLASKDTTEEARLSNILCVSHGGFLKSFLQKYCVPSCDSIANCSVSIVDIEWLSGIEDRTEASSFLSYPKNFTVSLLNDISHLS